MPFKARVSGAKETAAALMLHAAAGENKGNANPSPFIPVHRPRVRHAG